MQRVISQMIRSIVCRSNCAQKDPWLLLHGRLKTGKPFGDPELFEHEVTCRPSYRLQMYSFLYPAKMAC